MKKIHPVDYNFFPKSWVLPKDTKKLQTFLSKYQGEKPMPTFIIKPDALSQGKGIILSNKVDEINQAIEKSKNQLIIVQKYVKMPYLIDNLKFDLRLYVLVASCNPLKIFLYEEGLARFATSEYKNDDLENTYIHLTNYAINKFNENFK